MQSRRTNHRTLTILGLIVLAAGLSACGSEFSGEEEPVLTIEGEQGINLILPNDDERPSTQPSIELRNSGGADLVVTEVRLINTPPRLRFLGERGGSCTSDADCGEGICFADTQTCAQLGAPDTPFSVAPSTRNDIEVVITKGPRELACGEAPDGTPAAFVDDYCGELRIETRAINDGGFVENGNATLYFLAPSGSGQISVNPSFLQFNEVTTNFTDTKTFTISNDGQQTLTIREISAEDRSNLFTITPSTFPLEIEPGTAESFDLTLTIDGDEVELDFTTGINIDSSAANVAPFSVRVSTAAPPGPRISVAQQALVFNDAATQDLIIENVGMTTLTVSSLTVQPASIREFYTFAVDGMPFDGLAVQAGDSKTVQVTFTRPAGNIEDAVGELQIGHNDSANGNRTTVTLLGDAGNVAVGEVLPASATFLAATGQVQTRDFVIRNIGAGPLTITAFDPNITQGDESEFDVMGAIGTIQPGDFAKATVIYTPSNDTVDGGEFVFESDAVGGELILPVVSTNSTEMVTAVITPSFSGSLTAGALATFSSAETVPRSASRTWVLTGRPATSTAFAYKVGSNFSVQTDVAGTYEIAMTAREGTREVQTTTTFTVGE